MKLSISKKVKVYLTCHVILLLFASTYNSQNEVKNWIVGSGVRFNFMTNPVSITTAPTSTAAWFYLEGNSTISDASGNLLFSTDGRHVYNQNQAVMANGSGIYPINNTSSSQSALIVKQPQTQNIYYIFSLHAAATTTNFLRYSIVDMSLAAGLGSVTVKGATLAPAFESAEKLTGVKHCNGVDVWVVTRTRSTGQFFAYLLTASGLITTPVISQVAPSIIFNQGYMRISPNGNKIVYQAYNGIGQDVLVIHDFNTSTGSISTNSLILDGINLTSQAYGVEFSPDGSKLYLSCGVNSFSLNCIYQWDLCAGGEQAIKGSRYLIDSIATTNPGCALQLGTDGKIYQSRELANTISVINTPNNAGVACGYSLNMMSTGTSTALMRWGLPNHIVSYFQQPHSLFEYTLHCQTAQFAAYSNTLINTCSATNQSLQGISWNFGDPSSGVANVSSLQNPTHVFSALGTYTVRAIYQYQCRVDTITKTLNVIHGTPSFTLNGRASICKGESTVLSANTSSLSYFWFYPLPGGTTNTSISVNPQSTTIYSVTGTYGSCSLSKVITVTVSACTGLEYAFESYGLEVFPNPVSSELFVFLKDTTKQLELNQIILHDGLGREIKKQDVDLNAGIQKINVSEIDAGLYLLMVQSKNGESFYKRIVIQR